MPLGNLGCLGIRVPTTKVLPAVDFSFLGIRVGCVSTSNVVLLSFVLSICEEEISL